MTLKPRVVPVTTVPSPQEPGIFLRELENCPAAKAAFYRELLNKNKTNELLDFIFKKGEPNG